MVQVGFLEEVESKPSFLVGFSTGVCFLGEKHVSSKWSSLVGVRPLSAG